MTGSSHGENREARDASGELSKPEWIEHQVAMMRGLFPALATRAIKLARLQNAKADYQKEKKKALKDKVEVAHAANQLPPAEPGSMEALRREVEALKLAIKPRHQPSKKKTQAKGNSPTDNSTNIANTVTRKRQRETDGETQDKGKETIDEGHLGPFKRRRQKVESNDYRRQRREEAEADKLVSTSFSFERPSSYPNEVLNLPFSLQYRVIMSHANEMLSRKFSPGPYVQEGISVPDWVRLDLGVNLKYLFPSRFDLSLLKVAFNEFKCSLRWKYFGFNRGDNDDSWNPKLKLEHRAVNEAPEMTQFLEDGLVAEWAQLTQSAEVGPQSYPKPTGRLPEWKKLDCWLRKNKIFVKASDKNLGVVLVSQDWYKDKLEELLMVEAHYDEIDRREMKLCIPHVKGEVGALLYAMGGSLNDYKKWSRLHPDVTPQECDFIAEGMEHHDELPRFHGIPKIHKNPWKLRPIAPMHSWVTTNVARWLHTQLEPMLSMYETIFCSTKDATAMLKRIVVPERKDGFKLWICTADVVAMYPSIPLEDTGKGNPYDFRQFGLYSMMREVTSRAVYAGLISHEKRELTSKR